MERVIEINGAWDKRDPDPAKNYGIHGMEMRFILKGPAGAVQFLVYTNMHLPSVQRELAGQPSLSSLFPMGADIGYHARTPQYEGQGPRDTCPYLDGDPCYYDGSGCAASDFMPQFLAGGSDAVWEMLEKRYISQFGQP